MKFYIQHTIEICDESGTVIETHKFSRPVPNITAVRKAMPDMQELVRKLHLTIE